MKIRMTKKDEITNLLEELLIDIELDRIEGQQILLKTKRLLRLRPNIQIEKWIDLELFGYKNKEPFKKGTFSYKYMELTGRFFNSDKTEGIVSSFLAIDSYLDAEKTKLKLGNKNIYLSTNISKYSNLKGKIMALLHDYLTEVYYQIKYENVIESIFESYKHEIDKSIINESKEVIDMLPSVMDRLNENNTESISQALTTCRRIIDSFADVVFPAQDEKVSLGTQELEVKKGNVKNRINVYVDRRIESKTRKQRLRQNLSNLYDRVCTAVHNEVTSEEAKALVFNTYLLIGEILNLGENN